MNPLSLFIGTVLFGVFIALLLHLAAKAMSDRWESRRHEAIAKMRQSR